MVVLAWGALAGCASVDPKDTARDSAPIGDTAPPIDTGVDSGDIDADGDGWTPNAGDCNDELPHVHPEARDLCDGLDANCDGDPVDDGECGNPGDATLMWSWSFEGSAAREPYVTHALGDVDADGRGDVEAAQSPGYEIGTLVGARLDSLPARGPLPPLAWSFAFPIWAGGTLERGGDVNGDGIDDVWGWAGTDAGYTGAVFLFLGRASGFGEEATRLDLAADAVWTDNPRMEVAADGDAGDFNGDGLQDVAMYLQDDSDLYWATILGSADPQGADTLESIPRIALRQEFTQLLAGPQALTDLDGDGCDELAADTQREHDGWGILTLIEGEDVLTGGEVLDVGHDIWYETGDENVLELGFWRVYGVDPDTDGDGLGDLVFQVSTSASRRLVYTSGGIPNGSANDLAFSEVIGSATDYMWPDFWTDDVDDDGVADLMLDNNCVVASHRIAAGGTFVPAEVEGPCIGSPSGGLYAFTDMTGDGYADWVYTQTGWEPPEAAGETYNRALIIEGFPIPWDDPTKW